MQKEGVLHLKTQEIELEISQAAIFKDEPTQPTESEPEPNQPKLSEMDIALWSAPGFNPEPTEN